MYVKNTKVYFDTNFVFYAFYYISRYFLDTIDSANLVSFFWREVTGRNWRQNGVPSVSQKLQAMFPLQNV